MVAGIGTDILKMDSIPASSLMSGDAFFEKVYTAAEKRQAESAVPRNDWLRRRFAGKEAVFKALGADPEHARINEIEILDDRTGAPHVELYGALRAAAESRGIGRIHISLSSDGEYALAFAAAETMD